MNAYIGIDVGTSSVKVLAMDETGYVLGQAARAYENWEKKPGWIEIDPNIWFERAKEALKELLQSLDGTIVAALGFTGQMHTTVFLDSNGNSLRQAISWNDTRTKTAVGRIKESIANKASLQNNYSILSSGSPAMNLWWLKEHEPHHFQKLHKFLIGPDYLVYRFTGRYGTDFCEAATSSLFDLEKKQWSKDMQSLLQLPETIFPPIRGSGEIVGPVLPGLAEELGLHQNIPVVAGTGDNPAAYLAAGLLESKDPIFSLGTSGVLMFSKDKVNIEDKGKHILFSLDGKKVHVLIQGVVQSAGNSFSWWQNKIRGAGYSQVSAASNIAESELLFYPHLVGDKTIYGDPFLRGAFIGLGTDTTADDMTLAVMEGVCFGIKHLMEEMHISKENLSKIRVLGGGAKSQVWMQLLADVLQLTVESLPDYIGAAYGAAMLAAYSNLENRSLKNLNINEKDIEIKYPRSYSEQAYQKKFNRYKKIYSAMQSIYATKY